MSRIKVPELNQKFLSENFYMPRDLDINYQQTLIKLNLILSFLNTKPVFLFMDASGILMKTAYIAIFQNQTQNFWTNKLNKNKERDQRN